MTKVILSSASASFAPHFLACPLFLLSLGAAFLQGRPSILPEGHSYPIAS